MKRIERRTNFYTLWSKTLTIAIFLYLSLSQSVQAEERIWVDTSHWETRTYWVEEGHYETRVGRRWVDDSHYETRVREEPYTYYVWVKSGYWRTYVYDQWVDTSHWETRTEYWWYWTAWESVSRWHPRYPTSPPYYSLNRSGPRGYFTYREGNAEYKARDLTYAYKPHGFTRGFAVFVHDYRVRYYKRYTYTYRVWVRSGYWKTHTVREWVDTSHWEPRQGMRKVTYRELVRGGHWENYSYKVWVDTSHYETRQVWVESGYWISPLHATVIVKKDPPYVFTKWHKRSNGQPADMRLEISWTVNNSSLSPGEPPKKIDRLKIYQDVNRYKGMGTQRVVIFEGKVPASETGTLSRTVQFEHAGDATSTVHIFLYAQDGSAGQVQFANPINGFTSINVRPEETDLPADRWLGGQSVFNFSF